MHPSEDERLASAVITAEAHLADVLLHDEKPDRKILRELAWALPRHVILLELDDQARLLERLFTELLRPPPRGGMPDRRVEVALKDWLFQVRKVME